MPGPSQPAIALIQGDITTLKVDAIVNAANNRLVGGSGVDGAIHRAAGPELDQACAEIRDSQGGCPTGRAVSTPGFQLPVRWIIHTVGPVYSGSAQDAEMLASCYANSLDLARTLGASSIAFPNIATGVYGYPKAAAARIAVSTVRELLARWQTESRAIPQVIFVCLDEANYQLYQKLLG